MSDKDKWDDKIINALKEIEKKIAGKCCAEYFDFARNLPVENKKSGLTIEV